MTRPLPALFEGHAPFYMHQAFSDALDAYREWDAGAEEPRIPYDGHAVPISSVFGRMRRCTDLLPGRLFDDVAALEPEGQLCDVAEPPTYADAACIMRALCVERLRTVKVAAMPVRH